MKTNLPRGEMARLSREHGISAKIVRWRLVNGWEMNRAFTTPVGRHGYHPHARRPTVNRHSDLCVAHGGTLKSPDWCNRCLLNQRKERLAENLRAEDFATKGLGQSEYMAGNGVADILCDAGDSDL